MVFYQTGGGEGGSPRVIKNQTPFLEKYFFSSQNLGTCVTVTVTVTVVGDVGDVDPSPQNFGKD